MKFYRSKRAPRRVRPYRPAVTRPFSDFLPRLPPESPSLFRFALRRAFPQFEADISTGDSADHFSNRQKRHLQAWPLGFPVLANRQKRKCYQTERDPGVSEFLGNPLQSQLESRRSNR